LPISEFTPLFSLLGTTYGGDGKTTFGLPNLSGSLPLCMGQAPGSTVHHSLGQGGSFGGGTPAPTEQYMTVNFIIAYQGIFPPRN
jgi:microcystin-dependent protein